MRSILYSFLLFTPLIVPLYPAHAYWPTTVEENLPIATNPDTIEAYPCTLPYPDGKTLVVYQKSNWGDCYQILNRFGESILPPDELLTPGLSNQARHGDPKICRDDEGGAYIVWTPIFSSLPHIYAQRIDSSGNRLWGDEGVRVLPIADHQFDICPDSQGGFWLASTPGTACEDPDWGWLWVQRVDAAGNLTFGDSGLVAIYSPDGLEYARLAPDGEGGCFMVWEDNRLGMAVNAIYSQHLDGDGNVLWPQDLYICQETFTDSRRIISDGEGGFILQAHPGGASYNTHWRIDGDGNILWQREQLSWYYWAEIVPGEPGFFYLCWYHYGAIYGQRMDIQGNNYWPINGAQMSTLPPHMIVFPELASFYQYPYYYCAFNYHAAGYAVSDLYAQSLDSTGNRMWGDSGVLLASHQAEMISYTTLAPDAEGGAVVVWQKILADDVYAKRCNADGTLGGPFPLSVNLTPQNPPVQIPAGGGSFFYDIAIADSDSVGGSFDAWIEVTLPGGSTLEILSRSDLSVLPGDSLYRMDVEQFVPPNAPPGVYTYTAYAGNYDYLSTWGQDSFSFEKLASGSLDLENDSDWALTGFFGDEGVAASSPSNPQSASLSAHPNPFNATTVLSYQLQVAGRVTLSVYDVSGRRVAALVDGWRDAGAHEVTFDGKYHSSGIYVAELNAAQQSIIMKILLVK